MPFYDQQHDIGHTGNAILVSFDVWCRVAFLAATLCHCTANITFPLSDMI